MNNQSMFNVPPAVVRLGALMVVVHILTLVVPQDWYGTMLNWMSFVPARYGLAENGIDYIFGGEPFTDYTAFFTYAFLHGDATHLAMNGVWLLAMGTAVANRIGGTRFTVFFFVATAGGAGLHLLLHWGSLTPVIGASAGVSGLMAAAMRILFAPKAFARGADGRLRIVSGRLPDVTDRRVLMIAVVWVVMNLIVGLSGMVSASGQVIAIAWEAHLGGFLVGMVGFSLFDRRQDEPRLAIDESDPHI
ncbi:MAG: rhomboid family intramembrane serine protease [Alphaproteobacteria bacterium]